MGGGCVCGEGGNEGGVVEAFFHKSLPKEGKLSILDPRSYK